MAACTSAWRTGAQIHIIHPTNHAVHTPEWKYIIWHLYHILRTILDWHINTWFILGWFGNSSVKSTYLLFIYLLYVFDPLPIFILNEKPAFVHYPTIVNHSVYFQAWTHICQILFFIVKITLLSVEFMSSKCFVCFFLSFYFSPLWYLAEGLKELRFSSQSVPNQSIFYTSNVSLLEVLF